MLENQTNSLLPHHNCSTELLQENLHTITLLETDYTRIFPIFFFLLACIYI